MKYTVLGTIYLKLDYLNDLFSGFSYGYRHMPKRRFVGRRNGAVQQRIPTTRVIRRDSESSIASTESLVDQGSSVGVSHVHQRNVEESPVFRFSDSDEEPSSRQRRRISSSASGSDDETESSLLQPPSRRVRGGLDYDSGAEDRNGGRGMRFARGSRPVSSVPPDTIDPRSVPENLFYCSCCF